MDRLQTKYLGLQLRNPFIASSSGLTDSLNRIEKLAEAGVGAIVMKSLFEEQISNEADVLMMGEDYPEALDYINGYMQSNELDTYVKTLQEAKKKLPVPIIPSINCVGEGKWIDFAQRLEQAGADAIEINIFLLPTSPKHSSAHYEERYFRTLAKVTEKVKIPVSVKLTRQFTNPLYMLEQLRNRGVKGAVLFNRYYESEVDVKSMELAPAPVFSTPDELHPTLRWVSLAAAQIKDLDLAVSTGVHTGNDAAKALAVGAAAVQVCTALYKHGPRHVATLIQELESALTESGAGSVNAIQGQLAHVSPEKTLLFERSQFMKYFSSREDETV